MPYQNIGQFFQGSSLAFPSHVLRYGFLTISGRTGGVSVDAVATLASSAAGMVPRCIVSRSSTTLAKERR